MFDSEKYIPNKLGVKTLEQKIQILLILIILQMISDGLEISYFAYRNISVAQSGV